MTERQPSAEVGENCEEEGGKSIVETRGWACSQTLLMLAAAVLRTHTWSTCFRRVSMCRVTQEIGPRNLAQGTPALPCLHSRPAAHGQEQRQLGGAGEAPGLCFLLGVHCSLGAGVFRMQSSSSPAHYSPNMPSRSCLPKPLPSLIQCYQIPNAGTLKQMYCYQHATGHIFQKENSCSLNLSLVFSAPRTQRKSLRRACFPSFSSSVLKGQQAPSLSVQPSRSATHSP